MKIFITYGDSNFKESLNRIKSQAQRLGLFDKIIIYKPSDLPSFIKASPLMAYRRGGGYWVWKPYIIYHTLSQYNEGDIVYYADSGCTINNKSEEWVILTNYLKSYNAVFFQYRSEYNYPGWDKVCTIPENNSSKIIHWMKPSCVSFFNNYLQDESYQVFDKIWGGFIIIKKTRPILSVLENWYRLTLFKPELIMDPIGEELNHLPKTFNRHRHDQAILTPLVYHYKESDNILVLPETSESCKESAAVIASRYRVGKMPLGNYVKYKIYNYLHKK